MVLYTGSVHPTGSGTGSGSGWSYTSLDDALANFATDTSAGGGDQLRLQIEGDWSSTDDTAAVDFTGARGSADSLEIVADEDNYFRGDYDSSQYRLYVGGGSAFFGTETALTVRGIFVENYSASSAIEAAVRLFGGSATFIHCGARSASGSGFQADAGTLRMGACYGFDCTTSNQAGFLTRVAGVMFAYQCTARNCFRGFRRDGGTVTAKNCIGANCTDCWSGTSGGTHNGADDGGGTPGTNPLAASFTFESSTSGILSASDTSGAIGYAPNLSADSDFPFSTDILGEAYLSPATIGINEAAATGGPGTVEGTAAEDGATGSDAAAGGSTVAGNGDESGAAGVDVAAGISLVSGTGAESGAAGLDAATGAPVVTGVGAETGATGSDAASGTAVNVVTGVAVESGATGADAATGAPLVTGAGGESGAGGFDLGVGLSTVSGFASEVGSTGSDQIAQPPELITTPFTGNPLVVNRARGGTLVSSAAPGGTISRNSPHGGFLS